MSLYQEVNDLLEEAGGYDPEEESPSTPLRGDWSEERLRVFAQKAKALLFDLGFVLEDAVREKCRKCGAPCVPVPAQSEDQAQFCGCSKHLQWCEGCCIRESTRKKYKTFRVYGPGDDPAGLDPAGRVIEEYEGRALLSAGMSEFPTWDDVLQVGKDRRELAAIAWVLGAAEVQRRATE